MTAEPEGLTPLTPKPTTTEFRFLVPSYKGADKSLARPGRKQATATEEFDFNASSLYRN